MTAPLTDDIVSGAVSYLMTKPDILAALGSDADGPWLFQYDLWAMVEKSQSTACVVGHDGGWATANPHNTLRFPRISVAIWADPKRDGGNNAILPGEVQRRANHVFEVIDKYLHRVAGPDQMWGNIRTVSCVRITEPNILRVPDGDGMLRLLTYYAVTQG